MIESLKNLDVGSGCCLGDYKFLYEITKKFKWESAIEIGTNFGLGCIALCMGGVRRITTIDIKERPEAKQQIEQHGFIDRIKFLIGDSKRVLEGVRDRFSVAYIDGDHRYRGVLADVKGCKDLADYFILHDSVQCRDVETYKDVLISRGWKYLDVLSPKNIRSNFTSTRYRCWNTEDDLYSWRNGERNHKSFPGITLLEKPR